MRAYTTHLLLMIALGVSPALSEEENALTGEIELGYRNAQTDGSEDKYREDVNLEDDALRLFGLRLRHEPGEEAFYDRLTFEGNGFGGEPHSSARLGLRKTGRYDLDLRYRSSDYFYRDAGYFFRDGGDLHTWDADRSFYSLGLKIYPTRNLTLRFGAERAERDGGSSTSRSLQQDEFILSRPVDQTSETFWVGADIRVGWADISAEQRFTTYENRWRQSASDTDGEVVGAAFLDDYSQLGVEDADAPLSRVSIAGHPWERFGFSVGYAHSDADLDFDTNGDWGGMDFTSQPFRTTLSNEGTAERSSEMWEADFSLEILSNLQVILDYSHRDYDQDGSIDSKEVQTGGTDAGQFIVQGDLTDELDLDTYGVTLDWQATRTFGVAVGAGRQERKKSFELSGPDIETERTLYRGRLRWRPHPIWDLRLDYEQGEDDDPVNAVSVTSVDRIGFRADIRPTEGLLLAFKYQDESKENDLSTSLGLPTDDTPPVDEISLAEFDVTTWSLLATWSWRDLDLSVGYSGSEIDSDADIVFVTGFTFLPVFDIFTTLDQTDYMADQDIYHANVRYAFSKKWTAGARLVVYDSNGTFPVDSDRYGADLRYELESGIWIQATYDRYDYDEDNPFAGDPALLTPDINDYDADLVTVRVGYRF